MLGRGGGLRGGQPLGTVDQLQLLLFFVGDLGNFVGLRGNSLGRELAGRLAYWSKYLKPYKKLLVELAVSKTGLDRALSFADALFWQLEQSGHRVMIAAEHEHFSRPEVDQHEIPNKKNDWDRSELWAPLRPTIVYLGPVG